ncbi:T9SS type A sorting domain-containing protein [Flavobacterium phycosphaerae]|uniref:T9SS type A sorting domain-containing protein n=1 Tax=Flavobacterium phycosphaerae TaxID=2697515 RepID=UPI001389C88B|nr:T9SS type A sorting domain-containing protein [Flavobacterium phycosphaerae]
MKKLYFLLLLMANFAFAQPPIASPSPYQLCDLGNDGVETFDVSSKIDEILNGLDYNLYTVNFYADAPHTLPFVTPTTGSTTVYVRVVENANPSNFSDTTLDLVVLPLPIASFLTPSVYTCSGDNITMDVQASGGVGPYHVMYAVDGSPIQTIATGAGDQATILFPDLAVGVHTVILTLATSDATGCYQSLSETATITVFQQPTAGLPVNFYVEDTPYDGVAAFDFTPNSAIIANGQSNVSVLFYETLIDAYTGANPIINPPYFNIVSPTQVIYARVQNDLTGCFTVTNFTINVVDPNAVVNIPDANFKAKLIGTNCADFDNDGNFDGDADTNNDGQLQFSEAMAVYRLSVTNPFLPSPDAIADLTGIEAFTNLVDLNCSLNALTTFNFTLPSLRTLTIANNELTALDLTGFPNLLHLDCPQNNIVSLNLSATPNLMSLGCDYNDLTVLSLNGLSNLTGLSARYNNITLLDLSQATSLTSLQVDGNSFPLDVTTLVNLQSLGCSYMGLTDIDLTNNVNLTVLSMNGNNFTDLTLPSLPVLSTLFCGESTTMTSLNLNALPSLLTFQIINNPNMTELFLKNGMTAFGNFSLAENFNLQFVCVDDFNVNGISIHLALAGITGVNVCSYCSFTPGGDYNTIKGHVTFDADNNGCDLSDIPQPNIRVDLTDGINTGASFNNTAGNYAFYTQAGSFTLSPSVENPTWFTISPASDTVFFADNENNTVTKDFCITANGSHQDLEIVLAPLTTARPGFDATYQLTYRNKGNTILPAATAGLVLSYDIDKITYLSSSQPVTASGTNSINFDYPMLLPFASGSIDIMFHVNAPTDTPSVNIGDVLHFMAGIGPNNNDENVDDNSFQFNQTVVGSFDPNDITCLEGDVVAPTEIGKYLHYIVNFENTGTYQAENIVIRDEIDATKYDLSSLQVLSSSASVTTKMTNNIAEFIFQNINLDSGGHGNILLKIKSKTTLTQGDQVSKKANIYFDYNFPVETNNADTVFQTLSNPDFPMDGSITLYPNPTKDHINISSQFTIKSIQLYDIQGRLLQTQLMNEAKGVFDLTSQAKGVYFVKITSDKGSKVEKVVRE